MEVKFSNQYSITTTKYSVETYEHTSYDLLEDFLKWVEGDTYESEDELREVFEDHIKDNYDIVPNFQTSEVEVETWSMNFKLLNWHDIFPLISYLVVIPKELTCCDRAPKLANFCPTCSKSIIKN
jgi:hypothetical protein